MTPIHVYIEPQNEQTAAAMWLHLAQASVSYYYIGAASMGVNGFAFKPLDADNRTDLVKTLTDWGTQAGVTVRIETPKAVGKYIRIEYDDDPPCPMDDDGQWTLHSFCSKHKHYKDPDTLLRDPSGGEGLPLALRNKLKAGTAFFLSYFEHGLCKWGLAGSMDNTPDFRWDGTSMAGLLVWEHPTSDMGAKTYADRQKDAAGFLREYTAWCNGEVYGYVIEDEDGDTLDSCFGHVGSDGLEDQIAELFEQWGQLEPKGHLAETYVP